MSNETLAYNPDDWKDGADGLKHYGWGIVDKDDEYAGTYYSKEDAENYLEIEDRYFKLNAPHRVVELFYREEEK